MDATVVRSWGVFEAAEDDGRVGESRKGEGQAPAPSSSTPTARTRITPPLHSMYYESASAINDDDGIILSMHRIGYMVTSTS